MKAIYLYTKSILTVIIITAFTACGSKEDNSIITPPPPPDATLESILLQTPPEKTAYTLSEAIDLNGLKVIGTYSNGEKQAIQITTNNISGFSSEEPAETQEITVSVDSKKASFTIKVLPMRVTNGVLTEIIDGYPELQLPNGVKSIQSNVFTHKSTTKVILNQGLESIAENAFSTSNIQEINFPSSLKTIGEYAFYNCKELNAVDLSQTQITVIENNAFGHAGMKELKLPSSLTDIKTQAFRSTANLEVLVIPTSVKNIELEAFRECGIRTLELPNSISKIAPRAFYLAPNIVEVTTYGPESNDNPNAILDDSSFEGCPELTIFNIPTSIRILGQGIIGVNKKVSSITIPAHVTQMRFSTFGNTGVKNIIVKATTPPTAVLIYDLIWSGFPNSITSITVPPGTAALYKAAQGWKEFATKITQ